MYSENLFSIFQLYLNFSMLFALIEKKKNYPFVPLSWLTSLLVSALHK